MSLLMSPQLFFYMFAAVAIGHTFTYFTFNALAFSVGGLALAIPVLRDAVPREGWRLAAAGTAVALGTRLLLGRRRDKITSAEPRRPARTSRKTRHAVTPFPNRLTEQDLRLLLAP